MRNINPLWLINMRHIITVILVLFSVTTFAQKDIIRGQQFELTGTIINTVSLPPQCGTVAWGTVVEFEIIKFSDSEYKSETIPLIVTCPESYKDNFFQVGHSYKITAADENQADFGWSIPNESILKEYKLDKNLWVVGAEKIR